MKLVPACLFLLVTVLAPNPASAQELIDRIVAVVNDEAITLSELNNEGKDFFQQIIAQAPPGEVEAALNKARTEVLASLVNTRISAQKAAELGVSVSDAEVTATVDQLLKNNRITLEAFRQDLIASGKTEAGFRDSVRERLMKRKLVEIEVQSKIVITDEKAKEYYENNYTRKKDEAGYYILQMGFSWDKDAKLAALSDEQKKEAKIEAEKRAQEVRAQAVAGGNFRELARQHSDLPSAVEGGDIGFFKEDEMAVYMRRTITALAPGEISPIVETASGYQFFKLLSTESGGVVPFESVQNEIREILYQQEIERQYKKWLDGLREQSYVKLML